MPELPQIAPAGGFAAPELAKPSISAGAATEGLQRGADEVMDKAVALGSHFMAMRRMNQFNLAQAEHADQADEATIGPEGVLNNPDIRNNPDLARMTTQTRLDALTGDLLKKYPLANYDGMLARNLAIRNRGIARSVFLHAHTNLEQSTKDESDAAGMATLNTALTASDPKDRQTAVTNYYQTLDKQVDMGLWTPGERDLKRAQFGAALVKGQFQALALSDPAKVLMMIEPPAGIEPRDLLAIRSMARDQVVQPWANAEAQLKARTGAAEDKIWHDLAGGTVDRGEVERLRAHGEISDQMYEMVNGRPYRANMPSAPGAVKAAMDGIAHATSLEELDRINEDNLANIADQSLNPRDGAQIRGRIADRRAELNRAAKSGETQEWAKLDNELFPPTSKLDREMDPFQKILTREQVHTQFRAAMDRNRGDAVKARKEIEVEFREMLKAPGGSGAIGGALGDVLGKP